MFIKLIDGTDLFEIINSVLNAYVYISYVQIDNDIMCYSFSPLNSITDFYVNCIDINIQMQITGKLLRLYDSVRLNNMIF